jgi:hypothetical protein
VKIHGDSLQTQSPDLKGLEGKHTGGDAERGTSSKRKLPKNPSDLLRALSGRDDDEGLSPREKVLRQRGNDTLQHRGPVRSSI